MTEVDAVSSSISSTSFGTLPDDTPVELWTVSNGVLHASFTNYGARLVSLQTPDAAGKLAHVVLGYETLELYVKDKTYAGAVVGRFANRIADGRFTLAGESYDVPQNDATNALHGGKTGFDRKVWAAKAVAGGVEFQLVSPDGDQGFPGELTVNARYTLDGGSIRIDYEATTDATTIVNVTNHAYFNLSGELSATIVDHVITVPAERFTPVNEDLIPTGELALVEGTPFDLRRPVPINEHVDDDDVQVQRVGGYDHNWVLGGSGAVENGTMKLAAKVSDPKSGRTLTVHTTEPGIQFYSGNFIDGTMPDRSGGVYERRAGLCLETQHYPDSPNQPDFPSTALRPGETMRSTTVFTFGAEHQREE